MVPIKFRIAYEGKFYYWGFMEVPVLGDIELNFVPPNNLPLAEGAESKDYYRWIMDHSERLLRYDGNGDEVYEGDILKLQHLTGTYRPEDVYFKERDRFGQRFLPPDHYIKCGNIHNIKEQLT